MTSRLAGAASPYLRSHADHPVAWYPWGEEAFAVARDRDVPVFISIGYSTCHWCHVMARESFASPDIAAVLNDGFVAIKVDREEHPEVDAAYMAAASAFTRNLGWPLSIFATPSGQTFHAGTYWPARAAGGVPAFADVLAAVSDAWHERRGEVESSAAAVAAALAAVPVADAAAFSAADLSAAARRLMAREDPVHGGFGTTGAKFPLAGALGFLAAMPDATANDVASFALRAMASSELFDPVDGGFFRYATRPDWTQPHFERMLTDNAQLLQVAIELGDTALALRIGAFLRDVLLQPSGGFGAAQDAESVIDGEISEGGYYAAANRADLTPPAVDAKVVTGWNGLAIAALARLSLYTADSAWATLAADAAASVLERAHTPRGWVRATLGDIASRAPASAADLAQLAAGLTTLAQATGEVVWAVQARDLVDTLRADPQFGADPVLSALGVATGPDAGDGDEPSAAAALALAATDLADLGAGDEYRRVAEDLVQARFGRAAAEPLAYGATLQVATRLVRPPRQVIGVTPEASSRVASAARGARGDIVMILTPQQAVAFTDAGFDLLSGKTVEALYVCENFTCALPQTEADLATPNPE